MANSRERGTRPDELIQPLGAPQLGPQIFILMLEMFLAVNAAQGSDGPGYRTGRIPIGRCLDSDP